MQLLDFLDPELDGLLFKLLQLRLLLLKLRLQSVVCGLRLFKPLLGGLGVLQRLHLHVLLGILAPRLFDFRKFGCERRLLLQVRKAVGVTRERGVPLCVGLAEGFRVLRPQRGNGLSLRLLKLDQVLGGVPREKHGFPQIVEGFLHRLGLRDDLRRTADVGANLLKQIGLHLERVAADFCELLFRRAHCRQRGGIAVNGLLVVLRLLLNLGERREHLVQHLDIAVDVSRPVLTDQPVRVLGVQPVVLHGFRQRVDLPNERLGLLLRFGRGRPDGGDGVRDRVHAGHGGQRLGPALFRSDVQRAEHGRHVDAGNDALQRVERHSLEILTGGGQNLLRLIRVVELEIPRRPVRIAVRNVSPARRAPTTEADRGVLKPRHDLRAVLLRQRLREIEDGRGGLDGDLSQRIKHRVGVGHAGPVRPRAVDHRVFPVGAQQVGVSDVGVH